MENEKKHKNKHVFYIGILMTFGGDFVDKRFRKKSPTNVIKIPTYNETCLFFMTDMSDIFLRNYFKNFGGRNKKYH